MESSKRLERVSVRVEGSHSTASIMLAGKLRQRVDVSCDNGETEFRVACTREELVKALEGLNLIVVE